MADELLSVSEIAEKLGCPQHKVQYLVMSRRIDPVRRVGGCRLFAADVVEKLRQEIEGGRAVAHVS